MARGGKQAISKTQIQARRKAKQRLFLRLTYIVLFISLVVWGWSLIHNPNFFPVKHVVIHGSYQHVDPATIKTTVQPFLDSSLFLFNGRKLQQQLQRMPWIESAEIHRRWPDTISISLTEKNPIARWGKLGLITQKGEIFFPSKLTGNLNLPDIKTIPDLIPQALALLNQVNLQLVAINLQVQALILSQREAVSLLLTTVKGSTNAPHFKLLLGRTEMQARLQRFIEVYPSVFENRINEVQYVDMRYANGMAVKWASQILEN